MNRPQAFAASLTVAVVVLGAFASPTAAQGVGASVAAPRATTQGAVTETAPAARTKARAALRHRSGRHPVAKAADPAPAPAPVDDGAPPLVDIVKA